MDVDAQNKHVAQAFLDAITARVLDMDSKERMAAAFTMAYDRNYEDIRRYVQGLDTQGSVSPGRAGDDMIGLLSLGNPFNPTFAQAALARGRLDDLEYVARFAGGVLGRLLGAATYFLTTPYSIAYSGPGGYLTTAKQQMLLLVVSVEGIRSLQPPSHPVPQELLYAQLERIRTSLLRDDAAWAKRFKVCGPFNLSAELRKQVEHFFVALQDLIRERAL